MPESKLAAKLGFTIEPVMGRMTIKGHHPNCVYRASEEEIALWNLCLELSERLETAEKIETQRNKLFGFVVRFSQAHYKYVPNIVYIEANELVGPQATEDSERLAEKEKKA